MSIAKRELLLAVTSLLFLLPRPGPAQESDYPSKPVTIIAPSQPGGGFDLFGRTMADGLSKELGKSFVVENRTGAGTLVGSQIAAKAAPDGYTLLVGGLSNIVFNAALYKDPKYDPQADFTPIGLVMNSSYLLITRKDLPVSSYQDLLSYARANPNQLTIATGGPGTGQDLLARALISAADIKLNLIPYRGAQAAYQDLLGGRIDLFIDALTTVRPQLEARNVKALLITSPQRVKSVPEVPTARELGVTDLEAGTWFGLFAPKKTPAPVVDKLRTALVKSMKDPAVVDRLERSGVEMMNLTPAETEKFIKAEYDRWTGFIRKTGASLD